MGFNCYTCNDEISWREPMIIIKNKAYCEECAKKIDDSFLRRR